MGETAVNQEEDFGGEVDTRSRSSRRLEYGLDIVVGVEGRA